MFKGNNEPNIEGSCSKWGEVDRVAPPGVKYVTYTALPELFHEHVPRSGSRIQKGGGGFVQEFRLENRSYPDVHDFSLRMQVIIAND